jgi:hypothetical protein
MTRAVSVLFYLPSVAGWTARLVNVIIAAFKALSVRFGPIQFDSAQYKGVATGTPGLERACAQNMNS